MALKLTDLVALSRGDEVAQKIEMTQDVFSDPKSRDRLIEAKMIEPGGYVTDKGVEVIQKIRKREKELRKGVEYKERTVRDWRRICKDGATPWFFTMLGKDQIVTNGELLFVGSPEPQMNAIRGDPDTKNMIMDVIRKCGEEKRKQIWPHSYQSFSLGGIDVVWMSDIEQGVFIPIQGKYFDYVIGRYPRASFWGSSPEFPIQAKVRSKGVVDSTVAILATFDVAGEMKQPNKIEGWKVAGNGEEMQKTDLPPVEGEGGGPVSEGEKE